MAPEPSELNRAARVAGIWYLVWSVTGMYNMLYVSPKIFVAGDAAATGANMLAHETLFKTSIVNGFISIVLTLVLMWALYRLFEHVSKSQAMLMVALFLVTVPAGFVMTAFDIASLMVFKGDVLTTFDVAQRQDLALFIHELNDYMTIAFLAFWGLWLFPLAGLTYRSRFLPRFLGVWLAINGLAYVMQSVTSLFWPGYKEMVFNYSLPAMLGELVFAVWLVARGARPRKP